MNARVQLLISQVFLADFSWADLEDYLSVKKKNLIKQIKVFFKDQKDADEKVKQIISRVEENEKKRNTTETEEVFVR